MNESKSEHLNEVDMLLKAHQQDLSKANWLADHSGYFACNGLLQRLIHSFEQCNFVYVVGLDTSYTDDSRYMHFYLALALHKYLELINEENYKHNDYQGMSTHICYGY